MERKYLKPQRDKKNRKDPYENMNGRVFHFDDDLPNDATGDGGGEAT